MANTSRAERFIDFVSEPRAIVLLIGGFLWAYNYLALALPIYFFWESSVIANAIITISIVSLILPEVGILIKLFGKKRRNTARKAVTFFFTFLFILIKVALVSSTALTKAKDLIEVDEQIIERLGTIKGFGLIPLSGSVSSTRGAEVDYDIASFRLIVKGEKAFKLIDIWLERENNSSWTFEMDWAD